jgi:hypothetical protein
VRLHDILPFSDIIGARAMVFHQYTWFTSEHENPLG